LTEEQRRDATQIRDFTTGGKPFGALARETKMTLFTLASVVVGAALGFGYYRLVGCSSGACPITSNPYVSTLYGALLGYLIGAGVGL
jgi:hypothetical protein